ncbi:MAG: T9SS type A sorting domain-containing protein [Bacteroidota bacterium]
MAAFYTYIVTTPIWEKQISDYSINALRLHNIDPDSTKELIVFDDGALSIFDFDEDSLKCTDIYGYTLGFINNMHVGDKNNDGIFEVFTSGIISVLEFELNPLAAVGLEEYEMLSQRFLLYPNPNSGTFQVSPFQNMKAASHLKVFSLMGELIFEQEISKKDIPPLKVQLPNVKSGIYLVQIWGGAELLQIMKMSVQN